MSDKSLTPKQRAYLRNRLKNPTISKSQAMRDAGYSQGSIQGSYRARVEKGIAGGLKRAMEKAGITDEKLANRLNQCLDANKKTKADMYMRLRGIELSARLRGDYVEKYEDTNLGSLQADVMERLLNGMKKVKDKPK